MGNKEKGKIYITISVLMLLFGWILVIVCLRPLRAAGMYLFGVGSEYTLFHQVLAVDFIALLIGIHGILLLHSEKK